MTDHRPATSLHVPRVLVLYASQEVTGPARGLLQLITTARKRVTFTLCLFAKPGVKSDLHLAAEAVGISVRVISQRASFDPSMLWQAFRLPQDGNCTVVQSHGYKTHLLAGAVRQRWGVPWLAVSHGWTDEDRRIRAYNVLDQRLLQSPDTCVAVSRDLASRVGELRLGRRTTVIPNAIEEDRFPSLDRDLCRRQLRSRLSLPEDATVVVAIGRLSREKGQDQLLRTVARLGDQSDSDPFVVCVGDGPERERLKALAHGLGLGPRVRFVGYSKNVSVYYVGSDLMILPSRSEGLPNVILEAHLLGCPVVGFEVGGVGEIIKDGETGWLVPAGDLDALARAIGEALGDSHRRQVVARNAREALFPRFSVDRRAATFVAEYQRLMSQEG